MGVNFCTGCGAAVAGAAFCQNCGRPTGMEPQSTALTSSPVGTAATSAPTYPPPPSADRPSSALPPPPQDRRPLAPAGSAAVRPPTEPIAYLSVGLGVFGAAVVLASTALPFASLKLGSVPLADVTGYGSPAGLTPWIAGIPVGFFAVLVALGAIGLAVVGLVVQLPEGSRPWPSMALIAIGVIGAMLFVGDFIGVILKTEDANNGSPFGMHLEVTLGIGLLGMLLGATLIVAGGVVPLLQASAQNKKAALPPPPV
jgi:hypothetical protein